MFRHFFAGWAIFTAITLSLPLQIALASLENHHPELTTREMQDCHAQFAVVPYQFGNFAFGTGTVLCQSLDTLLPEVQYAFTVIIHKTDGVGLGTDQSLVGTLKSSSGTEDPRVFHDLVGTSWRSHSGLQIHNDNLSMDVSLDQIDHADYGAGQELVANTIWMMRPLDGTAQAYDPDYSDYTQLDLELDDE